MTYHRSGSALDLPVTVASTNTPSLGTFTRVPECAWTLVVVNLSPLVSLLFTVVSFCWLTCAFRLAVSPTRRSFVSCSIALNAG